jgi:hypothetical protein
MDDALVQADFALECLWKVNYYTVLHQLLVPSHVCQRTGDHTCLTSK